ncbi:4-alpha-glucanotransferase [Cupriavidus necator]|uniref:4-alpha-glucanotransferase n=1 Tax=Cupriavidus necator (strain ATCC 17699 / DSM 428 / KCTC 22496 / NCIMB 10442 / H16 / Stanier 337) TaxID=381666 RepID=Q0K0X6_CUPNH|nr:4-alpha-glucanotransferase [Cupriavidus necator]KUE90113.1 4-alpha-glucanotransferase [Cupriavidus necator]QCC04188.1 4-alpha-glucanotransferase [Cupriavidus necator H16]QQB78876.1 4-alpha-glucanotransferase [Cupriavidus necator]WKA43094.1 4-alpha-glucanotransferase [Cupriavidus necator]CAJ96348.1 4-Alpha-glucanotransferase [Cupriavidus necator H16]
MSRRATRHDTPTALHALALRAGLLPRWTDAWNQPQTVSDAALRRVLDGLGLPCATTGQCEASRAWLASDDAAHALPPLVTAERGKPVAVPWPHTLPQRSYRLTLEDGAIVTGTAERGNDGSARDSDGTMLLPAIDVCGYHRLELGDAHTVLAIAPPRCYGVADALRHAGRAGELTRPWGLAVQLYGLRRGAPCGLGDLSALTQCCISAAGASADAVAINPLHAGFAALPERYSPYAPSSRLFLNPLYADPAVQFGQAAVDWAVAALGAGESLQALEARSEIDWVKLTPLRYAILRWLWERSDALLPRAALDDCAAFRARGGTALHAHACYEAIQARRLADSANGMNHNPAPDWRCWPVTLRAPGDAAVAAFAQAHANEVAYHAFLQWITADGMARAQRAARGAGMAVGIVSDLAVGADPGGSQAWTRQQEILAGFHAGAPPDLYNPLGQDWGVAVFSPRGLRRRGYAAFLEMLRANLAHAGGLRIDHVLGLARMWLVPAGAPASEGAYLRYPLQDMLRLVALESWRHRAIIIGENLGTVPPELNAALSARGVLGIDVLWFQREESAPVDAAEAAQRVPAPAPDTVPAFLPPAAWPPDAIATTSTHDLPTVTGWWAGRDLAWRDRLHLLAPGETLAAMQAGRARERGALWQALCAAGLCSGAVPDPADAPLDAVLAWLGTARTAMRLVPLEDLLGEAEQPNLPGTTSVHPNWQRRLDADVRALFDTPMVRARANALRGGRHGARHPPPRA